MVVFSCLRPCIRQGLRLTTAPSWKSALTVKGKYAQFNLVQKRFGGHGLEKRTIDRYTFKLFVDDLIFYTLLGVVPLGILLIVLNLVVGQGVLTDIPEGYEPYPHEYFQHPVSRFMARYILDSPQRQYEMNLDRVYRREREVQYSLLKKRVKMAMNEHRDIQGGMFYRVDQARVYEKQRDMGKFAKYSGAEV